MDNLDDCDVNADCTYLGGDSYTCECRDGFEDLGSGLIGQCEDIDECLNMTICADVTKQCVNTNGSFYCECRPGFHYNTIGDTCEESQKVQGEFIIINEEYKENYANPNSIEYKQFEEQFKTAMNGIYKNSETTKYTYQETELLELLEGSVKPVYTLVFNDNANIDTLTLEALLFESLDVGMLDTGNDIWEIPPFTISYTDFDACDYDELNDCSDNANCHTLSDGKFNCSCKNGFEDLNTAYPGRYCEALTTTTESPVEKLPQDDTDAMQIVLGVLVAVLLLAFILIAVFAVYQYCQRKSEKQSYNAAGHLTAIQPNDYVIDALNDGGGWDDFGLGNFDVDGRLTRSYSGSTGSLNTADERHIAAVIEHAPDLNEHMDRRFSVTPRPSYDLHESTFGTPRIDESDIQPDVEGSDSSAPSVSFRRPPLRPDLSGIPEERITLPRPRPIHVYDERGAAYGQSPSLTPDLEAPAAAIDEEPVNRERLKRISGYSYTDI